MGEARVGTSINSIRETAIASRINSGWFGSRQDYMAFLNEAMKAGYSREDAGKLLEVFFSGQSPANFESIVQVLKGMSREKGKDLDSKINGIIKELSKPGGNYQEGADDLVDVIKDSRVNHIDSLKIINAVAKSHPSGAELYNRAVVNLADKEVSLSIQVAAGLAAAGVSGADIASAINALKNGDPAKLMDLIAKNPDVKSCLPKSMQDARDSAAFIDAIAGLGGGALTDLGDKVSGAGKARAAVAEAARKAAAEAAAAAAAKKAAPQAESQRQPATDIEAAQKFCTDLKLTQLSGDLGSRQNIALALTRSFLADDSSPELYARCRALTGDPTQSGTPSGKLASEIVKLIDAKEAIDAQEFSRAGNEIVALLSSSKDLPGLLSGISDYKGTATTTTATSPTAGAGTGASTQLQQQVTDLCNKKIDAEALNKLGIPAGKYAKVIEDLSNIKSGNITAANVDDETRKVLYYLCKKGVDEKYEATNQAISEQELAEATAAFKVKVGMSRNLSSEVAQKLGPETFKRLCGLSKPGYQFKGKEVLNDIESIKIFKQCERLTKRNPPDLEKALVLIKNNFGPDKEKTYFLDGKQIAELTTSDVVEFVKMNLDSLQKHLNALKGHELRAKQWEGVLKDLDDASKKQAALARIKSAYGNLNPKPDYLREWNEQDVGTIKRLLTDWIAYDKQQAGLE